MINAIFLCAGYATRLYPLTENHPKPLLPVDGRPILEWILERVEKVREVRRAFVVTNHRFADQFENWAKGVRTPWPLVIVDDQTTTNENRLGAIGDLAYVLKTRRIGAEDVLLLAGDNFFDFDLEAFVAFAKSKGPHPSLALYDVRDRDLAKQYGLVKQDQEGRVLEFYEKPENPPTTMASCGIYWLPAESRVLLDTYRKAGHNSDQPGHYMRWLSETTKLFAAPLKGHWLDIGDRSSYEKANTLVHKFVHLEKRE